ncbi:MAG: response regulator [Phaeodactylibacter sp.]|nr:response regulator [Phaeodactylibacter sp.]
MNRFPGLIILCFLFAASPFQAQDINGLPKVYPSYSEDFSDYSSFPSTCFERAFQDIDGRLWLIPCASARTQASLNLFQFDGYEFKFVRGEIENLPVDPKFIGLDPQKTTLVGFSTGTEANRLFFYDLQNHRLRFEDIHLEGEIKLGGIFEEKRVLLAFQQVDRFVIAEWRSGQFTELGSLKDLGGLNHNSEVFYLNEQEAWVSVGGTANYLVRYNFRTNTVKKYFLSDFVTRELGINTGTIVVNPDAMKVNPLDDVFIFLKDLSAENAVVQYKYNKEKDIIERVERQPENVSATSLVFSDDSGNYLFLFQDKNKKHEAFLQDAAGVCYDYSTFFTDLEGGKVYSLWGQDFRDQVGICSDQGIHIKNAINTSGIRHFLDGEGIRAMVELPDNKVMITSQTVGNDLLGLKDNTVSKISVPGCPFDVQHFRTAFYYDQAGKLVTSDGDLMIKYDPLTQSCESFAPGIGTIRSFCPVNPDEYALITNDGRLFLYRFSTNQATPLLDNGKPIQIPGFPNGMIYGQKDRLWLASNSGLWKINLATQQMEVLGKEAPFVDPRFLSMKQDKKGRLWLGTVLGGLNIYDPDTGDMIIVNSDAGLANNTVASILEDEDGDWWLGTYNGISIVNSNGELITNLNLKDGLIEKENNRFAALRTQDGKLLFGTINGLHLIDPKIIKGRVEQKNNLRIYLTSLEYFDEEKGAKRKESDRLNDLDKFKLPSANRYLNLSFALSSYFKPKESQYAYMLEGIDSDWTFLGSQHTLMLNNLPPGKYRLLIKGRDANGYWAREPLALDIHAREFFYKSPWFYALIFLLAGLAAIIWIWRLRIEINEATQQIREDKAIIETQAERLKEKDKTKSLFFTNISHEFRTPLTVISGMANQIEGQDKIKTLIKRNSLSLLNLVNQILDLRKLELGKLKLELVQADVVQYLQYLLASYEAMAELKGVKLHFIPKEKELFMDFDQEKLLRIVSNLLSNAIKFTPKDGHVYLVLEKRSMEKEAGQSVEALYLSVSDTGVGIPKDKQAHVFDRFYQLEEEAGTRAKKYQYRGPGLSAETTGSGIGLALTKDLITLMGGSISLESAPGKGSTFTMLLPVSREATKVDIGQQTVEDLTTVALDQVQVQVEKTAAPLLTSAISGASSSELSLLIIEDNRDVQQYLITLLESKYTLYLAGDGQEGIEMAFEHIPDLIISDVMMPEKDGMEVCDTLKNDDRTSHIPIVLLTAKASVESRIQGLERGADAYLAKPFNEKELFIRLEKLAELRRLLQQRYQQIRPPADAVQPAPSADFTKEDAFMAKLMRAVEEHLEDTNFGPTQLCQAMGMSRSHLHLKIKALTNRSTSIFIRTIRLHKAKELLQKGELNVTQIAFEVGFNDLSYFSRTFTEEFGMNPQNVVPS